MTDAEAQKWADWLRDNLTAQLNPDLASDVEVEPVESAGHSYLRFEVRLFNLPVVPYVWPNGVSQPSE